MSPLKSMVILPFTLIASTFLLLGGCRTMHFDYPEPSAYDANKGITVTVGEFKNDLGWSNPNRFKVNLYLDRPIDEAVRNAVIVELKRDGYKVGESPYEISGVIESFVSAPDYTVIQYKVTDKKRQKVLYDKRVRADATVIGIFDEKGHVQEVRQCILKFLNDPDFRGGFVPGTNSPR